MSRRKLIVSFDGGIQPKNPGGTPTYGVTVSDESGHVIHEEYGLAFGDSTNNVAEWTAIKQALIFLWSMREHFDEAIIRGDSQLVIRQLSGEYACNSDRLKKLCYLCRNLLSNLVYDCKKVIELVWNIRDDNKRADELASVAYSLYKRGYKK